MFVLIMGVIGSKSRSPGQILVKFSLHSLSYIFGLSTVTQVSDAGPSWPSCFSGLTKILHQEVNRLTCQMKIQYNPGLEELTSLTLWWIP